MTNNKTTKNILILDQKDGKYLKMYADFIKGNFKNPNTNIEYAIFGDLAFELSDEEIMVTVKGENIKKYDLVYIRKAGLENNILANSLGICLKHLGITCYDTVFTKYSAKGNKLRSLIQLFVSGLSVPKSLYFCKPEIESNYDIISEKLGTPFVAKNIGLQRGKGVFLIHNWQDLRNLPDKVAPGNKSPYIFQKFIPIDHEYRLLVLDNKVGVWEEKVSINEEEFRNNVALGAKEVFLDVVNLPKQMHDISVSAAQALGIEVAGVDIITEKETDKIYVLEVNRGPGLTYDQSVSYEFKALASFVENEVWNNK
jgi:glutathione synthase/RimK-type ligase-like ATP-grasp enzyme